MAYESSTQHLAETLEHLERHWTGRRQAGTQQYRSQPLPPHPHAFTIALSREAGTQGTAVAQEVGKRLGWLVYDHELLERIAHEMGLRSTLLESVDERRQSWLLESFNALLSAPTSGNTVPLVNQTTYVHNLIKTVLALAVHGECIIVGRGASFILPSATTLRVRLVAPLKDRIATLARNLGISHEAAAHRVRTLDRERKDFVNSYFLKDPTDLRQFDLILCTARFSLAACAELIVDALRQLQAQAPKS